MELQLQVDSITAVKCCMDVAFENTQIGYDKILPIWLNYKIHILF